MKTAIVTDFLVQLGGAEIVTREIASLFPEADIYTLMARDEVIHTHFRNRRITEHPKFRDSRFRRRYYRKLLPFYPTYMEDFDLREYDLVISSSYLWAKGILCRPDATHISYIHTPIRQAWTKYHDYLYDENDIGRFSRFLMRYVMNYMRLWDVTSANRVDHFIANSTTVQTRINQIYRREAAVIHPPVAVRKLKETTEGRRRGDYYVTVGRLVPYKRIDLLIELFNAMPRQKLLIAGKGNDRSRLEKLAASDNITFLGYVDEQKKNTLVAEARGFLFAAEEDFGMSPVEAMALGTPVLGYGRGGTRDYIQPGVNGLFFDRQNKESLQHAFDEFRDTPFDPEQVRDSVAHFDRRFFSDKLQAFIREKTG